MSFEEMIYYIDNIVDLNDNIHMYKILCLMLIKSGFVVESIETPTTVFMSGIGLQCSNNTSSELRECKIYAVNEYTVQVVGALSNIDGARLYGIK